MDGYPRYGFWTASPKRGAMGFGTTHDGVRWEALPSPTMVPPLNGEVGAVEYIRYGPGLTKAGYYALLGTAGHMVSYNASAASGPYYAAIKNHVVLPSANSCYFARFFYSAEGELLVTHQAYSHEGRTYVSPFKRAVVDDAGTLRFGWWARNERLKGAEQAPPEPRRAARRSVSSTARSAPSSRRLSGCRPRPPRRLTPHGCPVSSSRRPAAAASSLPWTRLDAWCSPSCAMRRRPPTRRPCSGAPSTATSRYLRAPPSRCGRRPS